MFSVFFLLFLSLVSKVIADVSISKPTSGQTYTASNGTVAVELVWIESNSSPLLTTIEKYVFTVCTGPNTDINGLQALETVSASDITDYTINLSIPADIGADGLYYIQIYATVSSGYTIHYSNRFTLEGLTGSTEPSGSGSPPSAQVVTSDDESTLNDAERSSSFKVYYTSQTGLTRYAPMQTQPGSTITATTWTRRYPTSSVSYYSSINSDVSQVSTVTPGWSYTISSAVNYASRALNPSENGGWYEPSSKLKSASKLTTATSSTYA